jgi:hypothetical protein
VGRDFCVTGVGPWVSLVLNRVGVKSIFSQTLVTQGKELILSEELFGIFDKADEDDNCGTGKANKEHRFEHSHGKDGDGEHREILARFRAAGNQDRIRDACDCAVGRLRALGTGRYTPLL